jgi:hypothetical protein
MRLRLLVAVGGLLVLGGCGPCGSDEEPARPEAQAPPPALTPVPSPSPSPPAALTPTPTPTPETASLAIGITEQNPNLIWPAGTKAVAPEFAPSRDALGEIKPNYFRLIVDWGQLEPERGKPVFDGYFEGCMRAIQPCGAYLSLRDQLGALAARQKQGGWVTLVVLHGTPEWAARPAGGCERDETMPRSRPARNMADYGRFVGAVLAFARQVGAELRYWSPWNEPNHPYFISPQRQQCDRSARSAAVEPYVGMARALKQALDEAPGRQQLVLGELAGLDERRPMTTSVSEFVARIPKALACASPIWTQHGYVGGRDLADDLERALARKGCARPEQIWITETGVGAPRSGEERRTTPAAQRRACARLHRRLVRWYRDPLVTAAFQYTFREDDLFPTGLVSTDLTAAYSPLAEWKAWGMNARPEPSDPAPPDSCG